MSDAPEDVPTSPESLAQEASSPAPVSAEGSSSRPTREYDCCYQLPDECGVQKQGEQLTLRECRPCVSDHFGRNKACTKLIPRLVRFCRKHYQRSAYHKERWPFQKCELILMQLDWIEEDVPNVTFEIILKKSEMMRLSADSIAKASGSNSNKGKTKAAAETTTSTSSNPTAKPKGKGKAKEDDDDDYASPPSTPADDSKSKLFEAPIHILRHIETTFCGRNKTVSDCVDVVDWLRDHLDQGTLEDLPVVEFLPENLPPLKNEKGKTTTSSKASTGPKKVILRVSKKGAVQKP